jgi:hypothetical protein
MLPGLVIDSGDERRLGTDQAGEFVRDGSEHLGRPRPARYQRGYASQCGLLLGKLKQPCLVGWVAGARIGGIAHVGAGVWPAHKTEGSPMLDEPTSL